MLYDADIEKIADRVIDKLNESTRKTGECNIQNVDDERFFVPVKGPIGCFTNISGCGLFGDSEKVLASMKPKIVKGGFKLWKKYRHSTGKTLYICGSAHTEIYGNCLVGEDGNGNLSPIGQDEENTIGYEEITTKQQKSNLTFEQAYLAMKDGDRVKPSGFKGFWLNGDDGISIFESTGSIGMYTKHSFVDEISDNLDTMIKLISANDWEILE